MELLLFCFTDSPPPERYHEWVSCITTSTVLLFSFRPVPVRRRPPSTGPRMGKWNTFPYSNYFKHFYCWTETRPLSAPRFPRTSSPEIDLTHHPPVSGRQHNDTYPGPSRPIPQPHPPRDSYSLDDRDRMVMRGPDEMKSLPPPPLHHHPRWEIT